MEQIPDFTDMTLPGGDSLADLSIGWLGDHVDNPGPTGSLTLEALRRAMGTNQLPDDSLDSHTCEICEQAHGHGHFFVEDINCRYLLPNLVTHYITEHLYQLPAEVERALLEDRRQMRLW